MNWKSFYQRMFICAIETSRENKIRLNESLDFMQNQNQFMKYSVGNE